MSAHLRSNVVGYVALFIALSGVAYATGLKKNSVKSKQIKNGQVKTQDLGDGAVATADLADGAVTSGKIADGVIPSSSLADGSVTTPKLAGGAVTAAKLDDGSVNSAKLADGSVDTAKLADGSVDAAKVIDEALGTAELAPNSVAASELADNAVDAAAIAGGAVTADELAADSVDASKVGANALGGADINEGGLVGVDAAALGGIAAGGFALAGHNHDAAYVNEGQADSVGAGMVSDTTRAIQLPLRSFIECTSDAGADIDFAGGTDVFPDFAGRPGNGDGFTLSFDATTGTEDENTRVCSQVIVPPDAIPAEGLDLIVRASKSGSGGAIESLNCGFGINGTTVADFGTATLASAAQTVYHCSGLPVFAAHDVISVSLAIASPGTMDDQVDVLGVELEYTATQ